MNKINNIFILSLLLTTSALHSMDNRPDNSGNNPLDPQALMQLAGPLLVGKRIIIIGKSSEMASEGSYRGNGRYLGSRTTKWYHELAITLEDKTPPLTPEASDDEQDNQDVPSELDSWNEKVREVKEAQYDSCTIS